MTSRAVRRWGHPTDSFGGRTSDAEWWEDAASATHTITTGPPEDSHARASSAVPALGAAIIYSSHRIRTGLSVCVCVLGLWQERVADLCDSAKIPTGLIQLRNGPHRAMGRCRRHNEHKGRLWGYSLQGRKQRAPGTVAGFVGWNGEGSLLLQHAADKIHQRWLHRGSLSPGAQSVRFTSTVFICTCWVKCWWVTSRGRIWVSQTFTASLRLFRQRRWHNPTLSVWWSAFIVRSRKWQVHWGCDGFTSTENRGNC